MATPPVRHARGPSSGRGKVGRRIQSVVGPGLRQMYLELRHSISSAEYAVRLAIALFLRQSRLSVVSH